jgi:dolichyl-phosphate-mannose--protein O-mannosyl transferase
MSRVAMNDIYVTAGTTAGLAAFWVLWTSGERRWRYAAGALLGVALSIKWSAAAPLLICFVLDVLRSRGRIASVLEATAAFVLLPAAIYVASYSPSSPRGPASATGSRSSATRCASISARCRGTKTARPGGRGRSSSSRCGSSNSAKTVTSERSSRWGTRRSPGRSSPRCCTSVGASRSAANARTPRFLIGALGQWLAWAFLGRVTFIQYFLPALPFAVMAVATAILDACAPFARLRRVGPVVYVVACTALFIHFYPVWSAVAITRHDFASSRWMWFRRLARRLKDQPRS